MKQMLEIADLLLRQQPRAFVDHSEWNDQDIFSKLDAVHFLIVVGARRRQEKLLLIFDLKRTKTCFRRVVKGRKQGKQSIFKAILLTTYYYHYPRPYHLRLTNTTTQDHTTYHLLLPLPNNITLTTYYYHYPRPYHLLLPLPKTIPLKTYYYHYPRPYHLPLTTTTSTQDHTTCHLLLPLPKTIPLKTTTTTIPLLPKLVNIRATAFAIKGLMNEYAQDCINMQYYAWAINARMYICHDSMNTYYE